MNRKKSRKQALQEYHEQLMRENVRYRQAVRYEPLVKEYNKTKIKKLIRKSKRRLDFWTKKQIIERRFAFYGSL
jgi:translation initiation factor RLI1